MMANGKNHRDGGATKKNKEDGMTRGRGSIVRADEPDREPKIIGGKLMELGSSKKSLRLLRVGLQPCASPRDQRELTEYHQLRQLVENVRHTRSGKKKKPRKLKKGGQSSFKFLDEKKTSPTEEIHLPDCSIRDAGGEKDPVESAVGVIGWKQREDGVKKRGRI